MISFILPIRNEKPHPIYTTYSLLNSTPETEEAEVIWVANGCDKENTEWMNKMARMRLGKRGILRVIYSDKIGTWPARLAGIEEMRGDVICICCAHTVVWRDSVGKMLALLREKGEGIIHSCSLYMGDYAPPGQNWKIHQYGDPLARGQRFFRLRDTPYTVSGGSGSLTMVLKDEWDRFQGGIEPNMTVFQGGETYMDLKWWLLGSKVWLHPDTLKYHWVDKRPWRGDEHAKRGISVRSHSLWNEMIATWCVGGDEWLQRRFRKELTGNSLLAAFPPAIRYLCRESRKFILDNQVYDGLDELFNAEPWDYPKKDIPEHGVITSY